MNCSIHRTVFPIPDYPQTTPYPFCIVSNKSNIFSGSVEVFIRLFNANPCYFQKKHLFQRLSGCKLSFLFVNPSLLCVANHPIIIQVIPWTIHIGMTIQDSSSVSLHWFPFPLSCANTTVFISLLSSQIYFSFAYTHKATESHFLPSQRNAWFQSHSSHPLIKA